MLTARVLTSWITLLVAIAASSRVHAATPTDAKRALAIHWAPLVYQDTDANVLLTARDDYLTRIDFDGDWDAWNNQENMESDAFALPGAVYYAVIETVTHWYITYAFYHAYDSSIFNPSTSRVDEVLLIRHENDVEGVILTIRKDGTPFGAFRVMGTFAHDQIYYFKPDGSDVLLGDAHIDPVSGGPDSTAYFPDNDDHVAVFIEANGHGIGSQFRTLTPSASGSIVLGTETYDFIGGTGIVYYYDGGAPEEPQGLPVESVRYELRPVDELWERRHFVGESLYCDYADWVGERGCPLDSLAWSFGGSATPFGQCAANPPWGWASDGGGLARGEWFLDPANVVAFHHLADLPERNAPGFADYVSNSYLQADTFVRVDAPAAGTVWTTGTSATVTWSASDVGQGPALGATLQVELSRDGNAWEVLAADVPTPLGQVSWTVTPPEADSCRVRITVGTDCALSVSADSPCFSIVRGVTSSTETATATQFELVHPNPFTSTTTLRVHLARAGVVRLEVYDVAGRHVRTLARDAWRSSGAHTYSWDAHDDRNRRVAPGIYYYRLFADGVFHSGRVVVVR